MMTEDEIRAALHRHASRHVVNSTVPPATLARGRVPRLIAIVGLAAVTASVALSSLPLDELAGGSGGRTGPAGPPSAHREERVKETAGGAPLLLVTAEGWRVTRADQYDRDEGEMRFSDGMHELDLTWRDGADHEMYVEDREAGNDKTWDMTIAGRPARLIQYQGTTDFTALWREGGKSLELRGVFPTVDDYRAAASTLRYVDEDTWVAALPNDVVHPSERAKVVRSMLADVPVHPAVDVDELESSPLVSDRYQLGARVTGAAACAWIDQWVKAKKTGDEQSQREATAAMATSHEWAALRDMGDEGGWSEVLWEYADAMSGDGKVSGGVPLSVEDSYRDALGCDFL